MTRYTAEELEKQLKRSSKFREGRKEFEKDAGYWKGGCCNWGANHNLKEDCKLLSYSFNKISNLRDIKKELKECTSEVEFNAKKRNFLRKIEESIAGLQMKTDDVSSIFGICIVWAHEDIGGNIKTRVKNCQKELEQIKEALEKETYKWVQEIKELELEISKIQQNIKENTKKASLETDPVKKLTLIQSIEEDGKILQQKYQKKQELSNRFNFDPSKKVDDLISSMKKTIERSDKKPKSSSSSKNNKSQKDNYSSESEESSREENLNSPDSTQTSNNSNWFQDNQSLILIISAISLIIFLIYYQQEETNPNYYYDY